MVSLEAWRWERNSVLSKSTTCSSKMSQFWEFSVEHDEGIDQGGGRSDMELTFTNKDLKNASTMEEFPAGRPTGN